MSVQAFSECAQAWAATMRRRRELAIRFGQLLA